MRKMMMSKIFLAGAAASGLIGAGSAAAQYSQPRYDQSQYGQPRYDQSQYDRYDDGRGSAQANFRNRITTLQNRIQIGVQTGAITRIEAAPLREQLRQIQQLERRYAPGGFTQSERTQIQPRIQSLRQQIAGAERNDYASPRTSQDDAWGYEPDDRSTGRYGRNDYDRDDRGGRYGEDTRGYDDGVGFDDRYQVRVGSRVPTNLGGVPYELRRRYPETERYTYRSDGNRIYQVERRTGVIVQIYQGGSY